MQKPHAVKATWSLLDSEIPGSGDVTSLFHMTGLSHPGAGSPLRAASSQWARPRCDTRISASSGQRTGKKGESRSQSHSSRISGDHGFVTSARVRRPARPVRRLDPPVWVLLRRTRLVFFVLSFVRESYDAKLHLGRLEPEVKRQGAFSVKGGDCSRKLPKVFVLCRVSFCKAFFLVQKKINAMICAMFQDDF